MKINEKIKKFRKTFDLSQEELAQKLNLSRQTITKWETEGGLPDVNNLKPLADLFGVSVDYLLDDEKDYYESIMREKLELKEKNNFNNRYDYAISYLKEKYPEPNIIYGLSQTRKLSKLEWLVSLFVGPSTVELASYLDEFAIWFLVKKETQKLLVKVTEEYIEIRELSNLIDENKFVIEKNKFVKMKEV